MPPEWSSRVILCCLRCGPSRRLRCCCSFRASRPVSIGAFRSLADALKPRIDFRRLARYPHAVMSATINTRPHQPPRRGEHRRICCSTSTIRSTGASGGRRRSTRRSGSNKPILLSVGYAACHWCHVMAHESFEDEATARVMNELFVNIKVDREERPDIDQIYMNALHLLGEQGGWPLTMFLTPAGEPVWGGTYFPKEARYGRAAFTDVLRELARLFREEPDRIGKNRDALMARLSEKARPEGKVVVGLAELDRVASGIARAIDTQNGGLRGAPKFPAMQPVRIALARRRARAGRAERDADRGFGVLLARAAHPRAHLRGRDLRSSRRRLFALFGRRALAGAALREDALRQRAAPGAAGARACAHRPPAVPPARRRDGRMAGAGDDDAAGGVFGLARCGFGRRGGQILRLVGGRGRKRARTRGCGVFCSAL